MDLSTFSQKRFWLNVGIFSVILLIILGFFRAFYDPDQDARYSQGFEKQAKLKGNNPDKNHRRPQSGTNEEQTRPYQGTNEGAIQKYRGERFSSY